MTEALTAVLRFGFIVMGFNRIGASLSTYNESCRHLLRKLLFVHEGTQREQYFENPFVTYADTPEIPK
jgi:RimJ/RimL family protein N-acetyltransferase